MNENRDLLQYLYKKNTIQVFDNIFVAPNAFLYRRVFLDMMKESGNKFESLNDFLEQIDPVQIVEEQFQNSITQPIDKSQNPAYTSTPAVVRAPTSVVVPPRTPALTQPAHTKADDMLDRWMIKE